MYLLGYDIGSSSVKASLVDAQTGKCVASAFYPKSEAAIIAVKPGWAEQVPSSWWENLKLATADVLKTSSVAPSDIKAIGISYQMHGLVCVDKDHNVLRPSIIWCDSDPNYRVRPVRGHAVGLRGECSGEDSAGAVRHGCITSA